MATNLSERRSGLDALLRSIVKQRCGSENVYYQPPANLRMKYPCICYKLEKIRSPKADDRVYYLKDNNIVNSVKAIGWASWKEGFLFWETTHTQQLTAEAYNGDSIKKYGLCQKIITVEGTSSTTDSLYEKAKDELKKYGGSGFSGSLQISAADLADIGVDTDRLDFLKETYVLSEPHGIENWLPCAKEVIPLHELDEKDFTFGETTSKLSSLQAANFGTAGKAWNAIQSTIGYLNTK